jgi:hypothetical protein
VHIRADVHDPVVDPRVHSRRIAGSDLADRLDMARTSPVLPRWALVAAVSFGGACASPLDEHDSVVGDPATPGTVDPGDPVQVDTPPAGYPHADLDVGCAPIFRQSVVPEYRVTISASHWAAIEAEFLNPQLTASGAPEDPPYHPVELRVVDDDAEHAPAGVMLRLNGNTSWLQTIALDDDPKMQFVIAFNKVDTDGRFQGLRKIKLDMPRGDRTFLQARVALAWLRGRAGVPAQCANNARVFINGEYYGLYTSIEFQDKGFLKRVYGAADDDGDLWKAGRTIKTNEETHTTTRIDAFWDLEDLDGLRALTELETSMRAWVSEALIGDCDGYNQGRPNFLLYDRPSSRKFVWLVTDLDTSLDEDYLPPDATPVFAPDEGRWIRNAPHYLIALNDPDGLARYVRAMSLQLPKLDPEELETWIEDWSAQIADAAHDDPRRPFSSSQHAHALDQMQEYPALRAAYLEDWVECWEDGGVDADGDGFDMCRDCADDDASQSPAAEEVCDAIDNDCNGIVDDDAGCD